MIFFEIKSGRMKNLTHLPLKISQHALFQLIKPPSVFLNLRHSGCTFITYSLFNIRCSIFDILHSSKSIPGLLSRVLATACSYFHLAISLSFPESNTSGT